jgi:hypothetical protein
MQGRESSYASCEIEELSAAERFCNSYTHTGILQAAFSLDKRPLGDFCC